MARRFTAHDIADYARCPRAWWYERSLPAAHLDIATLETRLAARRAALGHRAERDPETLLLLRLLTRQDRFAGGRQAHALDARASHPSRHGGCLLPLMILGTTLLMLVALWA